MKIVYIGDSLTYGYMVREKDNYKLMAKTSEIILSSLT